jgi:hypothetical protein
MAMERGAFSMAILIPIGVIALVLATSVGIAVFTRRAGYSRGPLWQSPLTQFRESSPLRRRVVALGQIAFVAYLLAVWRGPSYLPHLLLALMFAAIGIVFFLEPRRPNTRVNLRWLGVSFTFLSLGELSLLLTPGNHRHSLLLLVIEIPIFVGAIVAFSLAYIRAYPPV